MPQSAIGSAHSYSLPTEVQPDESEGQTTAANPNEPTVSNWTSWTLPGATVALLTLGAYLTYRHSAGSSASSGLVPRIPDGGLLLAPVAGSRPSVRHLLALAQPGSTMVKAGAAVENPLDLTELATSCGHFERLFLELMKAGADSLGDAQRQKIAARLAAVPFVPNQASLNYRTRFFRFSLQTENDPREINKDLRRVLQAGTQTLLSDEIYGSPHVIAGLKKRVEELDRAIEDSAHQVRVRNAVPPGLSPLSAGVSDTVPLGVLTRQLIADRESLAQIKDRLNQVTLGRPRYNDEVNVLNDKVQILLERLVQLRPV